MLITFHDSFAFLGMIIAFMFISSVILYNDMILNKTDHIYSNWNNKKIKRFNFLS
jgi:hypothetical protein